MVGFSKSRGQTSIELVIGIGILLLVFIFCIMISMEKTQRSHELKTYLDVKRVSDIVSANIDTINQQGRGYSKYFSIPMFLQGGYGYNLTVEGGILVLTYEGKSYSRRLSSSDIIFYNYDLGLNKKNKVFFSDAGIEVTGHRPNLVVRENSLEVEYNSTSGNVTMSFILDNDAHVDSNSGLVRFSQIESTTRYVDREFPPISAFSSFRVNVTDEVLTTGNVIFLVDLDVTDNVSEGKEVDNMYNVSILIS